MTVRFNAGGDLPNPRSLFVALFDVLGFRDIVLRTPIHELMEAYQRLLQIKRHSTTIPVGSPAGTEAWRAPTTVFSDTILIWAEPTPHALDTFLSACSILIAEALRLNWPLRGGIAYGQCILNRRTRVFVGPAIVQAYEVEQAQEWIGAAFHKSSLTDSELGEVIKKHDCVKRYPVPVKPTWQSASLQWAVHWTHRIVDAEQVLHKLAKGAPPSAVSKYTAAAAYARKCNVARTKPSKP